MFITLLKYKQNYFKEYFPFINLHRKASTLYERFYVYILPNMI